MKQLKSSLENAQFNTIVPLNKIGVSGTNSQWDFGSSVLGDREEKREKERKEKRKKIRER